jgi:hypothetical protein
VEGKAVAAVRDIQRPVPTGSKAKPRPSLAVKFTYKDVAIVLEGAKMTVQHEQDKADEEEDEKPKKADSKTPDKKP